MKIRLVSDLHLDINSNYELDFKKEGLEDVFTIVAGDICGSPGKAAQWLKHNLNKGAFISGNHDVYESNMPIEDIKSFFTREFPLDSSITYFDNDVGVISKDIGDNVLLVADVMYTDYRYPAGFRNPTGDVKSNIVLADPWLNGRSGMNDFNYGTCKKIWPGVNDKDSLKEHRLVPQYYLEHHSNAFAAVTEVIESNEDKDIVLVTHHCLSPRCLDDEHAESSIVASYISDKEDWIKAHSNLKCICSGHIHARKEFHVGSTLYVMNPLGYCTEHYKLWSDKDKKYMPWTPDCIIDTDNWTVEFKLHDMPEWTRRYEEYTERFKKLAPFFI